MKKKILEEITLKVTPFDDSEFTNHPEFEDFTIRAFHKEVQVAYLKCYHESGRLYAFEVLVEPEYRRLGIATKIYNYAQEISGRTINPHHENPFNEDSDSVSSDALAFWQARQRMNKI